MGKFFRLCDTLNDWAGFAAICRMKSAQRKECVSHWNLKWKKSRKVKIDFNDRRVRASHSRIVSGFQFHAENPKKMWATHNTPHLSTDEMLKCHRKHGMFSTLKRSRRRTFNEKSWKAVQNFYWNFPLCYERQNEVSWRIFEVRLCDTVRSHRISNLLSLSWLEFYGHCQAAFLIFQRPHPPQLLDWLTETWLLYCRLWSLPLVLCFFSFFLFHYYVSLKFSLESRSRKSCESTSSWAHSYIYFFEEQWKPSFTSHNFISSSSSPLFRFCEHLRAFANFSWEKRRKKGENSYIWEEKKSRKIFTHCVLCWAYKHHHHRTPENDFSSVKRKKRVPSSWDPRPKK